MKFIIIICFFILNASASKVLVSKININYKSIISQNDLYYKEISKDVRCTTFNKELLNKVKYQASRYIIKGTPICYKDVNKFILNQVRFDFGNIEINRNGKIIGENKNYVKIKNYDGKIIKIYKNGI